MYKTNINILNKMIHVNKKYKDKYTYVWLFSNITRPGSYIQFLLNQYMFRYLLLQFRFRFMFFGSGSDTSSGNMPTPKHTFFVRSSLGYSVNQKWWGKQASNFVFGEKQHGVILRWTFGDISYFSWGNRQSIHFDFIYF